LRADRAATGEKCERREPQPERTASRENREEREPQIESTTRHHAATVSLAANGDRNSEPRWRRRTNL